MVERSLPIPEVRGSNPVIGKNIQLTFTVNSIEKTKINKKWPRMAHFYKKKALRTTRMGGGGVKALTQRLDPSTMAKVGDPKDPSKDFSGKKIPQNIFVRVKNPLHRQIMRKYYYLN